MRDDPFRRVPSVIGLVTALAIGTLALSACPASQRREPAGAEGAALLMRNLIRAGRVEIEVEEHALEEPFERAAASASRRRKSSSGSDDGAGHASLDRIVRGKGAARDASSAR